MHYPVPTIHLCCANLETDATTARMVALKDRWLPLMLTAPTTLRWRDQERKKKKRRRPSKFFSAAVHTLRYIQAIILLLCYECVRTLF